MGISLCMGPMEVKELQAVMLEVDIVGAHKELQWLHSITSQCLNCNTHTEKNTNTQLWYSLY